LSINAIVQQRISRPSVLRALVLVGAGCFAASPSHASVTSTWEDGAARDQSFSRVLVVGISPDFNQRCAFERAMAARIKSANTVALISCDVMPPRAALTRENVEAAVAAEKADAVLATSLISQAWGSKEGGTDDTRGGGQYKAIDSYYGVYGTVIATDFQTTTSITTVKGEALITSKLYETRGATVVYTVDSKVRKIESRGEALAELTPPIAKRLRRDGLIR
jgi:hypothetical protein